MYCSLSNLYYKRPHRFQKPVRFSQNQYSFLERKLVSQVFKTRKVSLALLKDTCSSARTFLRMQKPSRPRWERIHNPGNRLDRVGKTSTTLETVSTALGRHPQPWKPSRPRWERIHNLGNHLDGVGSISNSVEAIASKQWNIIF